MCVCCSTAPEKKKFLSSLPSLPKSVIGLIGEWCTSAKNSIGQFPGHMYPRFAVTVFARPAFPPGNILNAERKD